MIRILIVDDVESTREHLKKLISFEADIEVCATAENGQSAVDASQHYDPDVILMDINMPVMDGIQATELIAQVLPTTPVIIMSVQGERDYLRRAMQAGAREFLIKPFSYDELIAAVRRVYQLEQKKTSVDGDGAPSVTAGARGSLVTFAAGKGGVGTSLLATNIATLIRKKTGGSVLLVDLDLQFGDIGVNLNSDNSRSIIDALSSDTPGQLVEQELIDEVLVSGPEGIRMLLAPLTPELADLVTVEHFRNLLDYLVPRFEYIVLDTPRHLAEISVEALERADRIVLVATPSISSLKDTKLMLNLFDSLKVDDQNVSLLLNHTEPSTSKSKDTTEKNLQRSVSAEIPYDPKSVGESILKGLPFIVSFPDAEITKVVAGFTDTLLPEGVHGKKPGGDSNGQSDKKKPRKLFGK